MKDGAGHDQHAVSPSGEYRVDQLCTDFELAWKSEKRARMEDWLPRVPQAEQSRLLLELILVEVELRRAAGESPQAGEYHQRFPGQVDVVQAAFAGISNNPQSDKFLASEQLLFGIIALQNNFVTREQFVAAFDAWVQDKSHSLAAIFESQGALAADQRQALETLLAMFLKKHGGDPEKSLAALSAVPQVRPDLERLNDPDVEASLGHVGQCIPSDPHVLTTLPFTESSSLGRFRILRPHAKGGLGQVSVALDQDLNREVALKEIQPEHADNQTSRERFMLEAEITGGLQHPGIVPVYEMGQSVNGRPFYAMRFVKGDSLKDAIELFHKPDNPNRMDVGARQLALRQLLGRFIEVCNAMEYAHSRGVLHRDLKPGNIMVGKYGETLVVDWGLAKSVGKKEILSDEPTLRPLSALSSSGKTQPGSAIGTPAYMSPEQAAGRLEELGPASDVYSLGATLYQILCGRPAFEKQDLQEILAKVQRGDFPKPQSIVPEVPLQLEAICLKAMSLKPVDRYLTARALADDVEGYLAGSPVSGILSEMGRAALLRAQQSGDYQDFSRAVFAFDEAYGLWHGNELARDGVAQARLEFATAALKKGDFDLGLGIADPNNPAHSSVILQLRDSDQERSRLRAVSTKLRSAAVICLIMGFVAAGGYSFSMKNEAVRAVRNESFAITRSRQAEEELRIAKENEAKARQIAAEALAKVMSQE